MTRLKIATVAAVAIAALVSTGIVVVRASRLDRPKPPSAPIAAVAKSDDLPKPAAETKARPGTITIEARDLLTDAPVPSVRLEFSIGRGLKKISATTAASGTAQFSHAADIRYFFIGATREGFVPQAIRWDYDSSSPTPPDRLLFQMEKATTISGRVVDQDQKPIAGATVVVDVKKAYRNSRQWVDFRFDSATTDADGRWSFSGVPKEPDTVSLSVYHHLYLNSNPCYFMMDFKPLPALRNGTATLRLSHGTTIEGRVVAPTEYPSPTPRSSTANQEQWPTRFLR